jgi:hypothetical protein
MCLRRASKSLERSICRNDVSCVSCIVCVCHCACVRCAALCVMRHTGSTYTAWLSDCVTAVLRKGRHTSNHAQSSWQPQRNTAPLGQMRTSHAKPSHRHAARTHAHTPRALRPHALVPPSVSRRATGHVACWPPHGTARLSAEHAGLATAHGSIGAAALSAVATAHALTPESPGRF